MGQIRKRGGVWWIRYYRDGRRYEESARTDKKEEARDLLRTREGDIAKGAPISPKIGRLRFEDAAKDILNDYTTNGKRSHGNLKTTSNRGRAGTVVPRPADGVDHHGRRSRVRRRPTGEGLRERHDQS
jgi:hypothetical protein